MQDRYAGDIGDYFKLALLKELGRGRKLGVAWFKTEPKASEPAGDGGHIDYLSREEWESYDPDLHKSLKTLVGEGSRSIAVLETLLPTIDVVFHSRPVPTVAGRKAWLEETKTAFADRDLIFADPDNGIASERAAASGSAKSITLAEIRSLAWPVRPVIVYHHHTRRKGGNDEEVRFLGEALRGLDIGCVCAIRMKAWSPRVYFIVSPTRELWDAAEQVAKRWAPYARFYSISGPPDALGLPPESPYSERALRDEEKVAKAIDTGEYDALFKDSAMWQRVVARRDKLA